jgi:hypothetical protein
MGILPLIPPIDLPPPTPMTAIAINIGVGISPQPPVLKPLLLIAHQLLNSIEPP